MSSSRPGVLLVVSSPSGAGKTTLCNRLRGDFSDLGFSVSYTTRRPREGEQDGVHYHFVEQTRFQEMVTRDDFAEYAMVHGNMYGTSSALVRGALAGGRDLIFDIDYQGGLQLQAKFSEHAVLVFILPPSLEELQRRLHSRGTDAHDVIERRLRMAVEELRHYDRYDYLIMNDDLDRAYDALRAVYVAQLHRRERQAAFAAALVAAGEDPA